MSLYNTEKGISIGGGGEVAAKKGINLVQFVLTISQSGSTFVVVGLKITLTFN